ncbi:MULTISPECIES: FAD:protein FMN transferase [unclassified Pseudomonas]|uniref:FAD:protein FMN transferase n=1 Tax=unclassified Pseudomonas TaxID=196821 RepID=UPI002AC97966|nr:MULTISPECIES: FAD:protein FMN transferase [unclassified Pseudomonas]MEB0040910.1 FAD:protein FMN transferase [Pseudomonas sp. MH10]MEB0120958.1 FAD:protein FMN transferase [Pseudomonas sp. CCI1.2]WPX64384.1 FAD:protein FMN transferase [Pseudomonas sp. MH10]
MSLVLISAVTACDSGDSLESFTGPTMGSTYSVQYVRHSGGPQAKDIQPEVEAILAEVDRQMSTYRADSDIERFNKLPGNSCQPMPAGVLQLVRFGEQLSNDSQGSYDLTVEPLLDVWGFGPQARVERVPTPEQLAQVLQRVGHGHLSVDGDQLCKDAPIEVDFNSIAAGYAVDLISARLQALGIQSFLAEATGELKAVGKKADGSPWRVALETPRDDQQVAEKIVELDGYGVSTSGDYRNYFEQDGKRYSHTFDALTGAPIVHALASVTVIDHSALVADGLSTLLEILGPERGWAFADAHKIAAFFVIRADNGFIIRSSAEFDRLFPGKLQ